MEKNKSKINLKNIKSFLEGNFKMLLASAGIQQDHIKEQVAYRALICSDCMKNGECKVCHCPLPNKFYSSESCNKGERFPDLMSRPDWEKYKNDNDIK
jgi:hypothetical protein